jgi:two-component system, cell cycle sensor histidine kinase and response regulator CckA
MLPEPKSLPTILVVDDEKVVRILIRRQLEAVGYPVLDAPGGREAIQLILDQGAPIGLLITDVLMPFMNGRDLATRVSIIRPDLKVLFISAYSADILSGFRVGPPGAEFLRKPFKHGELPQRVDRLLSVGRTWRELNSQAA